MRKIITLIIFLLFLIYNLQAQQTEADSLLHIAETTKYDTIKVDHYIKIAEINQGSDTAKFLFYNKKALDLSKKIMYQKGITHALITYGKFYSVVTNFDTAVVFFEEAATLSQEYGLKENRVVALANCANVYCYTGNYEKGLKYFLDALVTMRELDNKESIATATNNIGSVYYLLEDSDNALKFYKEALEVYSELESKEGMALATANIGIVYYDSGELEKALQEYLKAEKLREKLPDNQQLAALYSSIGLVYGSMGNNDKSIEYNKKGIKLAEALGDLRALTGSYLNLSQYLEEIKRYTEARTYIKKALDISIENKMLLFQLQCYEKLSRLDSIDGEYLSALVNFKKSQTISDSLFSKEKSENLTEMQTKYETDKKEQENQILTQQKLLDDKKIEQQQILNYAFAIGGLLFLLAAVVFLISRSKVKKANSALQSLLVQVNQQKEEIQTQADNLEVTNNELQLVIATVNQQKEEIQAQADNLEDANIAILEKQGLIEHSHNQIKASINYAWRIQNAALPDTNIIDEKLNSHFILFKPRDVVSGDFYWVKKLGDFIMIAIADCTGHGVPGAFVSMLGISLLNDITAQGQILQPNEVLDELRSRIKLSLHQYGDDDEVQKDGMDIAFCTIDTKTLELQFSGAHNPIYIIRNGDNENDLTQLKADRMPIGIHRKERPFSLHNYQLQKNDLIYMFSDGYQDQFGGPKDKKYKTSQFKKLLIRSQNYDLAKQKELLDKAHSTWKGSAEQVDDILVMGIKV